MKKNLLKAAIAAGTALAVMSSIGCSSEPPAPKWGVSTAPEKPSVSSEDRLAFTMAQMEVSMPRDEAQRYAKQVCRDLREGFTSGDSMIFRMSEHPELDVMEHAAMVGAAVGSYCPEFASQVDREWS